MVRNSAGLVTTLFIKVLHVVHGYKNSKLLTLVEQN